MRNFIVSATLAMASFALDIEEALKEHILNQSQ